MSASAEDSVVSLSDIGLPALRRWAAPFGLDVVLVEDGAEIPGSYWGEREAGLIGNRLYVRLDTPVHSALHEACHYICMDSERRLGLHTDAGGSDQEEEAVCCLQALQADRIEGYSRERLFADMDAWGYHFRLGSAQAWFEQDSEDARAWLELREII